MINAVLFLCTGNYYRSRFAEILFNRQAEACGLSWRAESRALALDLATDNVGAISPFALQGLASRGIQTDAANRYPLQVTEDELQAAAHVVAMKEAEHRPMLAERFPAWVDRVEYWHVDDLDCAVPDATLSDVEQQVNGLLLKLR